MSLGIQAAGIAVLGVLKAQLCRPLIHQPDKGLLTPGNLHRRRVGCVVARRQQHARRQLMEGHTVPGCRPMVVPSTWMASESTVKYRS